jgi:hypothetical protein
MNNSFDNEFDLLHLNRQGLIPGPREDASSFKKRICNCLRVEIEDQEDTPSVPTAEALKRVEQLFDMRPDWLAIFYHNRSLAPWEGAATWIIHHEDKGIRTFVQLRRFFKTKARYLGIYNKDELLAHEMVHAARMAFDEPRYEELIAYQTCFAKWRKWVGSLAASSKEACLLVSALFLSFCSLFTELAFFNILTGPFWKMIFIIFQAMPLALFFLGAVRIAFRQMTWKRCLAHLSRAIKHPSKALAVAFRLTDAEIQYFAKAFPEDIASYASAQASISLRWKVICAAYF